jgi:hypothetical protein
MCQFMFIIHLVPLVLREIICMQEISQKWTNKVHRRQVGMTGGRGPTWWGRPTPPSVAQRPHPPCHVTDTLESLHTTLPALIHVGLMQRWRLSCLGSMGPLSFTWGGGKTDLQTDVLTAVTDLPTMQPPLGAIKHRWMARRCRGRSADAP